jgi:ATP-dependent DNA ligase
MSEFDLRPMLATLTDKPFDDPDWIFETKWDGFRAVAVARPGHASLYSRNLIDISRKYPTICEALSDMAQEAVLDGELVATARICARCRCSSARSCLRQSCPRARSCTTAPMSLVPG